MSAGAYLRRKVAEPAVIRWYQWRGDPLARSGPFTPKASAALEPWIREETARLLSQADPAGFETTVNLIGNGTVALLTAPDGRPQWDRLREEPALVPAAVEELLRYDSPVQMTSRNATQDVELGGTLIRSGTPVIVAIGGANRDPAVFDQPGRLLIDRPNAARHLSFSLGIHHCLGVALARLEGRIAVEELTSRYPGLTLAGTPVRRPLLVLRGFESVPVRP